MSFCNVTQCISVCEIPCIGFQMYSTVIRTRTIASVAYHGKTRVVLKRFASSAMGYIVPKTLSAIMDINLLRLLAGCRIPDC